MEENNSPVAGFEVFDSPEAMIASEETQVETPQQESQPVQEEQVSEPVTQEAPDAAQPEPQPEVQPEPQAEPQQEQPEYSQEDIESAVLNYASERLGMQIESFEQLQGAQQQTALDERVAKIAEFVETTGRGPEDWFRYQSLDPSGMDDLTAVRVNLASEYPNLSSSEINLLVQNSYPMDEKANDANTIQMSQLRLKVDAQKARAAISDLRDRYTAPAPEQDMDMDPIVDDQWISTMSKEVDQMTGLEFDLGGDKSFTFGFDDATKNRVKASNANIENFFDPFVDDEGNWNYDALSTHIAVTQNIDAIVRSAYQQGLGDGQRGLVDKAANVSTATPKQTGQEQNNPLSDQVRTLLRNSSSGLTFKI